MGVIFFVRLFLALLMLRTPEKIRLFITWKFDSGQILQLSVFHQIFRRRCWKHSVGCLLCRHSGWRSNEALLVLQFVELRSATVWNGFWFLLAQQIGAELGARCSHSFYFSRKEIHHFYATDRNWWTGKLGRGNVPGRVWKRQFHLAF